MLNTTDFDTETPTRASDDNTDSVTGRMRKAVLAPQVATDVPGQPPANPTVPTVAPTPAPPTYDQPIDPLAFSNDPNNEQVAGVPKTVDAPVAPPPPGGVAALPDWMGQIPPTDVSSVTADPVSTTPDTFTPRFGNPNDFVANDVNPSTPNTPVVPAGELAVGGQASAPPAPAPAPTGDPVPAPTDAGAPALPNIPGIANNTGIAGNANDPSPAGAPGAPPQVSPAADYATATPTDPENDLRSQTITPGPALDRFALAQSQLKSFNDQTAPYYEAALRDANRQAAATGRLGSGQLRTSLGDLANQRNIQLQTSGQDFLNSALEGSAADAHTNLASLLAEQQYQTQAQGQAFNQNVVGQQLQEQLTSGAFNRALQMLSAGNSNDPSGMQALLSSIYGNQANSANNSLANLVGNTTANNQASASGGDLQKLLAWLQSQGAAPKTVAPPTGTPAPSNVYDDD